MLFYPFTRLEILLFNSFTSHFFKSIFFQTIFIFVSIVTYGQEPVLQFEHLDMSDGFSDNRINQVMQDQHGIIWAATKFGVNRYDGDKVRLYPLANSITIYKLQVKGENNILVGTDRGLYNYHKEKDRFELYRPVDKKATDTIFNQKIFSISISNSQDFWIGGSTGKFYFIQEGKKNYSFNACRLNPSFPNADIISLSQDRFGKIWLGTSNGEVWSFDPRSKALHPLQEIENYYPISDILVDSQSQVWIASLGNGLYRYNLESKELSHYTAKAKRGESINNNIVLGLYEGNNERVFIGTDGGGINLYEPIKDKFTYFKQEDGEWGLSDNSILCFGRGMHNVIFAGTVHGGISYFKDRMSVYNVSPHKLAFETDKQGSRILEDSQANLWITAGRNGLRKYNPQTGEVDIFIDDKNNDKDLSGDIILSIIEDEKERIWIGSLREGLNIYDTKEQKFISFTGKENLSGIYAIEKGSDGHIWVGTTNGIVIYNEQLNIIKRLNTHTCEGLSNNRITSLYKDAKGEIWVGTENGLNILSAEGEWLESFYTSNKDNTSLSGNHILSIQEGPDLSVYVGTYGFGLNRYSRRDKKFERIGVQKGLYGKIVRGILIDHQKNIWLSTNLGLSRINNDTISNFGIQDGITPFRGGEASLSNSGRIYFAGNEGLSYFEPESLHQEISQPRVFFTGFKIVEEEDSREIEPSGFWDKQGSDILKLHADFSLFTVNFSSSNYFDLEDTEYFYKLEGLNNEWQALNKLNSITFSNLAPGAYNLHVTTKKGTEEPSIHKANIEFLVLPAFWQRREVQVISILLLGLSIFFLTNWRNRNIKKQRDDFKKIVAIRTREVEKEKDKAYKNELELLETERQNEQLKQKRLSDELKFKTEELTNSTLRTVHKNNLLVEIKEDFIAEGKKHIELKKFFDQIVGKIDDSLAIDTEWKQFYSIFKQVHPSFIPSLKKENPSLTDRELRLCALIKLNFPSQQIATLFGISLNSIKVARHRLRKKLKIEEGMSFEDFFKLKGL
ncbi:ligand-binding sensor domain-containing protein [Salegentibacter agarivorans]|uniref:Ligand-binding sensor domain-containing protein n=1 Tax=Salegentibacter agarivorans TaxID=345907 RepID=A0A1I2MZF9_9FLAO|nr:ligand-binding sensor domain-containing protein [Salegentibacter agarivorans]